MHYIICERSLEKGVWIKSMFSYRFIGANRLFFKPRFFDSTTSIFIELKEASLMMSLCDAIDENGQRYKFIFKSGDRMFSTDNDEDAMLIFEVDDG